MQPVTDETLRKAFSTQLDLGVDYQPKHRYTDDERLSATVTAHNTYHGEGHCDQPLVDYICALAGYIDVLETALHNSRLTVANQDKVLHEKQDEIMLLQSKLNELRDKYSDAMETIDVLGEINRADG